MQILGNVGDNILYFPEQARSLTIHSYVESAAFKCSSHFRLFDELPPPPPPRSPHKQLLARLLPRSLRRLRASPVQSVLAPLYSMHYTPGAKVGPLHAKLLDLRSV